MYIANYSRQQLLDHALSATGENLIHQCGRWKGKPLGIKKVNALITRYVRDQKSRGLLIERRPFVEARTEKRRAHYVYIPQNLDLFVNASENSNHLI